MTHPPLPETGVVRFIGWQKGFGRTPSTPLFNVNLPGHSLHKSTVSYATLIANDLPVPDYPAEGK